MTAPLWAEEPEWMEVTRHIHQRLMENKAALYQSPAEREKQTERPVD